MLGRTAALLLFASLPLIKPNSHSLKQGKSVLTVMVPGSILSKNKGWFNSKSSPKTKSFLICHAEQI
jgi:hypothetical protein